MRDGAKGGAGHAGQRWCSLVLGAKIEGSLEGGKGVYKAAM